MKKFLFIFLGTLSLSLGVIGIVVPGLPTTPFLLLAAWLYSRGSERLRQWLVNHRFLGGYIREYHEGLSLRTKIHAISLIWTMILVSVIWLIQTNWLKILLIIIAVIGTVVMSRLPGRKKKSD